MRLFGLDVRMQLYNRKQQRSLALLFQIPASESSGECGGLPAFLAAVVVNQPVAAALLLPLAVLDTQADAAQIVVVLLHVHQLLLGRRRAARARSAI